MVWILGLLLSAAFVPPEGAAPAADTVYCDAVFQTRSGRAFRIVPDCPDVENRELMEDQVRRQIRDATPVLNDLSVRDMTGRVFFRPEQVDGETVWRVQPGVISRINAYYPLNAYRSAVSGACTATYDVIEGVPENICIRCRASDFRGEFIRDAARHPPFALRQYGHAPATDLPGGFSASRKSVAGISRCAGLCR